MKNIIFTLLLFIFVRSTLACSCSDPYSFCIVHLNYDLTASYVIVDTVDHGVKMKVLTVLNGTEERDTIILRDIGGPYGICNDSIESLAKNIGHIGDTLIVALNKIKTIK